MRALAVSLLLLSFGSPRVQAQSEPGGQLYRTTLYRAAPGRLLELIEALRGVPARERSRLILRHTQGDHWDLMVLSAAAGMDAERDAPEPPPALVAWREDTFVTGPDLRARDAFWTGGFFHVEMFHALAGRRDELLEQRRMENDYLTALQRPANAIFVRVMGGSWDCFTIGAYRSLGHYAESEAIPAERQDAAARGAGFEGGDRIGTYLRSLMADHHDTLAVPVR